MSMVDEKRKQSVGQAVAQLHGTQIMNTVRCVECNSLWPGPSEITGPFKCTQCQREDRLVERVAVRVIEKLKEVILKGEEP